MSPWISILLLTFGVVLHAGKPKNDIKQSAADARLLKNIPVPDGTWLYINQITDDQGCWDATAIDVDTIIRVHKAASAIKTEPAKSQAQSRLRRFLTFDGPSEPSGEFSDQCPDKKKTAMLVAKANEKLKPHGLKLQHSPFRLQLYHDAGQGSSDYVAPRSGGLYEKVGSDGEKGAVGGTVTVEPAPQKDERYPMDRVIPAEAEITLTARPNPGFKFESWDTGEFVGATFKYTSIGKKPVLKITPTKDLSLTARFSAGGKR